MEGFGVEAHAKALNADSFQPQEDIGLKEESVLERHAPEIALRIRELQSVEHL